MLFGWLIWLVLVLVLVLALIFFTFASTIAAILVARAADAFKGKLKEFLVGLCSFITFGLHIFPKLGCFVAQWGGCLPLPQPNLHRDHTVRLSGCRQGFLIAEFSKFQINPKPSNVQFLYFIGVRLYPTPSGKQLDRVFDADRDGAGHGHLLPGWGGSGETLFQSLLVIFGCLATLTL